MSNFEGAVRKDSFRQIDDIVSTMIEVVYKFLILSIIIETCVEGLRSKNRKTERQGNRFYRAKKRPDFLLSGRLSVDRRKNARAGIRGI